MQVNMENFLPSCRTVCEEEIYSFAFHTNPVQSRGETLRHPKHLNTLLLLQFCKTVSMSVRHYEHMSGINWLNIHEC